MSFPPKLEVFLQIKSEFLNLEKFGKTGFFKKKRFHLFKRHLQQFRRVESLPVVAGRLVLKSLQIDDVNLSGGSLMKIV